MKQLFRELKRRNVYKVAVTYVVAAFVVLQLADLAAGAFDFPGWFEPMIWVVAGLGFPIALVVAWAFELTPEGVRRTAEAEPEEQAGESTTYRWIGLALVVLLTGGVWYAISSAGGETSKETIPAADTAQTTTGSTDRSVSRDRPFVAVLPLENLSTSEENRFFADGIHEEILSQLSKVSGLGVFARTTMRQYTDTDQSVHEIGRELDAQAVLEGSVRRSGGRVRITTQLIDPDSRDHLWSETYDRELSTAAVFDIQADIASKIASALKIHLLPSEGERIGRVPTPDLAAYDAYLKGRDFLWQFFAEGSASAVDSAVAYFQLSLDRDAAFAQAEGLLGWAYGVRFNVSDDPRWMDSAFAAAARAEQGGREVAEAHIARAYTYARADSTERAMQELGRALGLRPDHEIATLGMYDVLEDRHELAEGMPWILRAVRQAPREPVRLTLLVDALERLGLHEPGAQWCRHGRKYNPDTGVLLVRCAKIWEAQGDSSRAIGEIERFLERHPDNASAIFAHGEFLIRRGEFGEGLRSVEHYASLQREMFPVGSPTTAGDFELPHSFHALRAYALLRTGQTEKGRSELRSTAEGLNSELDAGSSDYADRLALLAGIYSAMGRADSARQILGRAVEEGHLGGRLESPLFDNHRNQPWFRELSSRTEAVLASERAKLRRMDIDLYPPGAESDSVR